MPCQAAVRLLPSLLAARAGRVACLAAGAAVGLVPALVTKGVIDALAHPGRRFAGLAWLILPGWARRWPAG